MGFPSKDHFALTIHCVVSTAIDKDGFTLVYFSHIWPLIEEL